MLKINLKKTIVFISIAMLMACANPSRWAMSKVDYDLIDEKEIKEAKLDSWYFKHRAESRINGLVEPDVVSWLVLNDRILIFYNERYYLYQGGNQLKTYGVFFQEKAYMYYTAYFPDGEVEIIFLNSSSGWERNLPAGTVVSFGFPYFSAEY